MGDKAVKKALQNNSEVIEKENSVSQQTKKQSQTTNSGSWRLKKGKAIYSSRIFYFCAQLPNPTEMARKQCPRTKAEQTHYIKVLRCLFLETRTSSPQSAPNQTHSNTKNIVQCAAFYTPCKKPNICPSGHVLLFEKCVINPNKKVPGGMKNQVLP